MDILSQMTERAKANRKRIVLPEGDEPRTLEAANILLKDEIADLILIVPSEHLCKFHIPFIPFLLLAILIILNLTIIPNYFTYFFNCKINQCTNYITCCVHQ